MTTQLRGMEAPPAAQRTTAQWDVRRGLRACIATALGILAAFPVWRLLDRPETGLAGSATVAMTDAYAGFVWTGFVLLLIPALLAARAVRAQSADRLASRLARLIEAPTTTRFAAGSALFAFIASAAFGLVVLDGQPNLIDAMTQLLHARLVAGGSLSGPGPQFGAFWQPQQSLFTPDSWVSQYPPGHIFMLALGMKAGIVWAVGPAMLSSTVFFTALTAERLVPDRIAVARAGVVLAAVSPFLISHAGAFMSHTTAAAFAAFAVFCAVRGAAGRTGWLVAAGLALGALVATRPLSGLTLAVVLSLWLVTLATGRTAVHALWRVAALAVGALPFVALIGLWNMHFFGSATAFGYGEALGPAAGLGFGVDPWGNTYGAVEAIAYTSAELAALSLFLLETPAPLIVAVAIWILLAARLTVGERLIAAWALAPLAAQLAYWHHGLFMGPRMLNETAPAWCLLVAIAIAGLVRRLPATLPGREEYSPRVFGTAAAAVAMAAAVFVFGPQRLSSYAQRPAAVSVSEMAAPGSVIFVHGGWTARVMSTLAASGMRLDSVETALRQNPTCRVQAYADARLGGGRLPELDLSPRSTGLPESVELSPGNRIRVAPGERLTGECARQAAADRLGTIDVSPLLWRGDLPGTAGSGRLYVRDLGPDLNGRLLDATPGRTAWVLMTRAPDAPLELVPYDQAMDLIWGRATGGI